MPKPDQKSKLDAITKVFADHNLGPPVENIDWWDCHGDVVLKHNGCQKLAISGGIRYLEPKWLSTGENGIWAVMISGYLPNHPEDIIYTTGESSPKNCKNQYPLAMADKRGKDRLTLRLLKLAKEGILSEAESEEKDQGLRERDDIIGGLKSELEALKKTIKNSTVKPAAEPTPDPKPKPDPKPRPFQKVQPQQPEPVRLPEEGLSSTVWKAWLKAANLKQDFFPPLGGTEKAKCTDRQLLDLFNAFITYREFGLTETMIHKQLKRYGAKNPRQLTDQQAKEFIAEIKNLG